MLCIFFFSSRRRHTRCALVTGVQTCALPICLFREPGEGTYLLVAAAGIRNLDRLRNCRAGDIRDGARFAAGNVAYRDRIIYRNARLTLRSEEHTSELQSLMRISYAVFCLKKKNKKDKSHTPIIYQLTHKLTLHQQQNK